MTDPEGRPGFLGNDLEIERVTKYIVQPLGDRTAFVEDIIEPGKGSALDKKPLGPTSVLITVDNISVRALRHLEEGKYDNGSIVRLDSGSIFQAGSGDVVIVFNNGAWPVLKRRLVNYSPESEDKI